MYGDVFAPAVHQHCTAGSAMHTLIEARGHCSWPQPIEMKDYFGERERERGGGVKLFKLWASGKIFLASGNKISASGNKIFPKGSIWGALGLTWGKMSPKCRQQVSKSIPKWSLEGPGRGLGSHLV